MKIPFVDVSRQFMKLRNQINPAVLSVLKKGNFILGEEVDEFEKAFGSYLGVKHCIGVASGSYAILLSLRALGVGKDTEVITVANTFISTVLPILELGAKPVLVDINPETYQMDTEQLKSVITKKTKVILPVHLYGIPAPIEEIMKIARKYNISVVEDACQAHGSSINNKRCGSFGAINAFSFYPGKNLGAAGDAGIVATNNDSLAHLVRAMRNIGQVEKYHHDVFGYNARLDTIQAAVLNVKLRYLDAWNEKRRVLAAEYSKNLSGLPLVLPMKLEKPFYENYHLYVIRTSKRDKLHDFLKRKGVSCGIHYPVPVHLSKALNGLINYKKGSFPITEKYAKEVLSLPIYPELSLNEIRWVCKLIKDFFSYEKA